MTNDLFYHNFFSVYKFFLHFFTFSFDLIYNDNWSIMLSKGVGYAAAVMAFWLNTFYIVVLAWALYYVWSSIALDVPWRSCDNEWNTRYCLSEIDLINKRERCADNPWLHLEDCKFLNSSLYQSPVREYWERNVLQVTSGLEEPGEVRMPLAITLLIVWIACYFCIWKGVKWTGKVRSTFFIYLCFDLSNYLPTNLSYYLWSDHHIDKKLCEEWFKIRSRLKTIYFTSDSFATFGVGHSIRYSFRFMAQIVGLSILEMGSIWIGC